MNEGKSEDRENENKEEVEKNIAVEIKYKKV
jgi:hypothetical protein